MIPVVETDQLRLRGMVRDDFPRFVALWQEPEVLRYIGREPRSEAKSWDVFLKIAGTWAIEGFGQWAIERKSDGAFIGQTGFFVGKRGLGEDFDAGPEAGWALSAQAQGQGLGREAVFAAHRWFDAQPFAGPTFVMIEIGHAASFAVAARLGYQPMRETEELGDRVMLLRRDGLG